MLYDPKFTQQQNRAIQEKLEFLQAIKNSSLTRKQVSNQISERREDWMDGYFDEMFAKYGHLPPEEFAWHVIFLEHMGIDPNYSIMRRINSRKIAVSSFNFCPYFEACKKLGFDTRDICQTVNEAGIQDMLDFLVFGFGCEQVVFSRNYGHIRPHKHFCQEYLEHVD